MNVGLTIDSSTFDSAMLMLAKKTGRSFSDVIKNEAHAILKKATTKTMPASTALINERYDYKGEGPTPKRVIKFVRLNGGNQRVRSVVKRGMWIERKKGRYWDPKRINPLFKQLQTKLKAMKKKAKDNRGQSKATWLWIAKRIKLKPITAPKYVLKALGLMPNSLKRKVFGKEEGQENYHVLIVNKGTTAMAPKSNKGPGGFIAFKDAFKGRETFFFINLGKGVFEDVRKTLAKYPGLKVEP